MFSTESYQNKDQFSQNYPQILPCGFSGAAISDIGCVKSNNEDNFLFQRNRNADSAAQCRIYSFCSQLPGKWQLACVFDGIGDGKTGQIASGKAAEIFCGALEDLEKACSKAEVDLIMAKIFLEANNKIVSLQKETAVMGTTAAAICTNGTEFKIYYLGDSRAYLVRKRKLMQITVDQTLAQIKIDAGIYRKDSPLVRIDRNKLTEYIGRDRTMKHIRPAESQWLPVRKNDRILLCSDGLTHWCTDEKICEILQKGSSPEETGWKLVGMARKNGGDDNITCIVLSFF